MVIAAQAFRCSRWGPELTGLQTTFTPLCREYYVDLGSYQGAFCVAANDVFMAMQSTLR
jgi:hypothetical protein